MAAVLEELFGIGLLKIPCTYLCTGNMGGDGQHRRITAMGIIEAIYQMHVAGTATADANRQPSGELSFGAGGKGRGLLMPVVVPAQRPRFPYLVGDRIRRIAYNAMDLCDPRGGKGLNKHFCNFHDDSFSVDQVTQSPYQVYSSGNHFIAK